LWCARGRTDITGRADADEEHAYGLKNGHPEYPPPSLGTKPWIKGRGSWIET
jgi:hypothetical protein